MPGPATGWYLIICCCLLAALIPTTANLQEEGYWTSGTYYSSDVGNEIFMQPAYQLSSDDPCYGKKCSINKQCVVRDLKSAVCRCKSGFRVHGRGCKDIDECANSITGGCVHYCFNSQGSYLCHCRTGFQAETTPGSDGRNCIDVNECQILNGECSHKCVNTMGSYYCTCPPGYRISSDMRTCEAFSYYASCQQVMGDNGYCNCYRGYHMDSRGHCELSSCEISNGGCQHRCNKFHGETRVRCSCHPGYNLHEDGNACIPTCGLRKLNCLHKCVDTLSGPSCACQDGYLLSPNDNRTCHDINECNTNNGGCSDTCVNIEGSYRCECPPGYHLLMDEMTCVDIDECGTKDSCDHVCHNLPGTYSCACNLGYQLYALTRCTDINECDLSNGGCAQECLNTEGSFYCTCTPGYQLHMNNKDCIEKNERMCPIIYPPAKSVRYCQNTLDFNRCSVTCEDGAHFLEEVHGRSYEMRCDPISSYQWKVNMTSRSSSIPCSANVFGMSLRRVASFQLETGSCHLLSYRNINKQIEESLIDQIKDRRVCRPRKCPLKVLSTSCITKQEHAFTGPIIMQLKLEFEVFSTPDAPSHSCDETCMKRRARKHVKRLLKRTERRIKNLRMRLRLHDKKYYASRRTLKVDRLHYYCPPGAVPVEDYCVSCSSGTYYSNTSHTCNECKPGTYQDEEGKYECKPCPSIRNPHLSETSGWGANNLTQCQGYCNRGYISMDGTGPCWPCPVGSYQMEIGRTSCMPCKYKRMTLGEGAVSQLACLSKEICQPGSYYKHETNRCRACGKGFYQPLTNQDSCVQCPKYSTTDDTGSTSIKLYNYPNGMPCTWDMSTRPGKRVLVIVPEIHLAHRTCDENQMVIRKDKGRYSEIVHEFCETHTEPRAFTSSDHQLIAYFHSNSVNTSTGFRAPFVAYHEYYQDLIEDIIMDRNLIKLHKNVLQDKKLRSALLEVIDNPNTFFNYMNKPDPILPTSFVEFLAPKITAFLQKFNER